MELAEEASFHLMLRPEYEAHIGTEAVRQALPSCNSMWPPLPNPPQIVPKSFHSRCQAKLNLRQWSVLRRADSRRDAGP